jgi:photosystem II stability/assembly factor-like uncharacterized protein
LIEDLAMKNIIFVISIFLSILFVQCASVTEPTYSGWTAKNKGLPKGATVTAITNIANTGTLFIGTHNGVYKSTNNGDLWVEKNSGLTAQDISCIAAGDAASQIVYAGAWGKGVFRSSDGGDNWQSVWSSDKNPHINALYVSSIDQAVYAATEHGLFKSSDFGDTWSHIFNYGKIRTVAVQPKNPDIIYIGARWHGNLRSEDGGQTWHKINNGVYDTGQDVAASNCFLFNAENPGEIYMSTGWIDLYKTQNGGDNWQHVAQDLSERSVKAIHGRAKKMWALSENDGLFVTHDAGGSWSHSTDGLGDLKIKSLYMTKTKSGSLFAGTLGNGIYKYEGD